MHFYKERVFHYSYLRSFGASTTRLKLKSSVGFTTDGSAKPLDFQSFIVALASDHGMAYACPFEILRECDCALLLVKHRKIAIVIPVKVHHFDRA